MKKTYILVIALALMSIQTLAQGIIVKKTDGTEVRFPADIVESISVYGFETRGTAEGHEYVNLDLPSGTLWATCNIGASKPEEYGDYYAWGETATKSVYNWDTYQYGRSSSDVDNIGKDIAGTKYDVAHVKWGGGWRMPTLEQIKELLNNTTNEWTTLNGVAGRLFTGKNGGTVFLPAAGLRWYGELNIAGSYGYYWSSTLNESSPYYAWYLDFDWRLLAAWDRDNGSRFGGQSVRPVR